MSEKPRPREAEEVPGDLWSGPRRDIHVYPYGHRPELRVYAEGRWRRAVVGARHTLPDGRIYLSCSVRLPHPLLGEAYLHRPYWWSPGRMRVVWDGRTP